jgi:hypothetical protein
MQISAENKSAVFTYSNENKVYTTPSAATENSLFDLEQVFKVLLSSHPSIPKIRKIVEQGFKENVSAKEIKQQIKPYKNDLPFFLLSGYCRKHHNDLELQYNSFIQIDIDFKFLNGNYKAAELKKQVQQFSFVVFAAISPSGYGLKLLVKTDNYRKEHHKKVTDAVIHFLSKRLNIDKVYFDSLGASQPCFVPYDADAYINRSYTAFDSITGIAEHNSEIAAERQKQLQKDRISFDADIDFSTTASELDILKYCVSNLIKLNIDITDSYQNWVSTAFSCASVGAAAKDLFHTLARQNSSYNEKQNERLFADALKKSAENNIGYIVNRCKEHNISISHFYKRKGSIQQLRTKHQLNEIYLSAVEYCSHYLKAEFFSIGLYSLIGGTGIGKSFFIGTSFDKCIVISRNITTLENYNKYGFERFTAANFRAKQLPNKITVTYKSAANLLENYDLKGYVIVFDESHLLNESFTAVESETKYCYNAIAKLKESNTVILASANKTYLSDLDADIDTTYYFKKKDVLRHVNISYNAKELHLQQKVEQRISENRKVLIYTNRKESKRICKFIQQQFSTYSIDFFDSTKHNEIDLENLQSDITITTSALVTGKDILNQNLSLIIYSLDIDISRSTLIQFFGRARNHKSAVFDVLFTFKQNTQYGKYSVFNIRNGLLDIARATIRASVNDYSFLRENKSFFVTKKNGKLEIDYFNIDKELQKRISMHTIRNAETICDFLHQHNYTAAVEHLKDVELQKVVEIETAIDKLKLYDLELNEIDANNQLNIDFYTNVLNRFELLCRIGFDRNTALDICNAYKSKKQFQTFADLLIVERSLLESADAGFIHFYNVVFDKLNQYLTTKMIVETLATISTKETFELARITKKCKTIDIENSAMLRKILKELSSYYSFDRKRLSTGKYYKAEKTEFLQYCSSLKNVSAYNLQQLKRFSAVLK